MAPKAGQSNNPAGVDGTTRRFNRNLAQFVREGVPADKLVEFQVAILMGHDPVLVEDKRATGGWRVSWKEQGEFAPTLDQKQGAWKNIVSWGYGLPAQTIQLDQELRAHIQTAGPDFDVSRLAELPPEKIQQYRDLMRLVAGPAMGQADFVPDGTAAEPVEMPKEAVPAWRARKPRQASVKVIDAETGQVGMADVPGTGDDE